MPNERRRTDTTVFFAGAPARTTMVREDTNKSLGKPIGTSLESAAVFIHRENRNRRTVHGKRCGSNVVTSRHRGGIGEECPRTELGPKAAPGRRYEGIRRATVMPIGFRLAVKRRSCRGIPCRTRQSYADSRPRSRVLGREFARKLTKPHVDQNSASTSVRGVTRKILFARRRFRADLNFRVSSVDVTANNRRPEDTGEGTTAAGLVTPPDHTRPGWQCDQPFGNRTDPRPRIRFRGATHPKRYVRLGSSRRSNARFRQKQN